jgi:ElaB/YqjD/DUF883 family membrane-anchored ribosome-binding protein
MTSSDPDQLRRDIERTQHNLSTDVDMLAEKVTPGRVVHRKVNRARRAMTNAKDRVMGTATSATDGIGDTASSVAQSTSSMASSAAETVGQAPQAIRRGTEGNPLAAGLIAFGAGWLLSSLAPASKPEQQVAGQVTDWAREPLAEQASQLADTMREPAKHAAESVKSTASDAATTVTDDARSAVGDVTDRAQEAKSSVQEHRS